MQYRDGAAVVVGIGVEERSDQVAPLARHARFVRPFRLVTSLCFLLMAAVWFHFVRDGLRLFAADPGVGWHIASGQYVFSHRAVPHQDPFLGYVPPLPWVSDQWASDLFLAVGYALGGWPLLYNVLLAGYFAIYFAGLFTILRSEQSPTLAAFVGALFAAKVGEIHFILRPTMVGFLLCVALLWGICHLEKRWFHRVGSGSRLWVPILGFSLLFGVWANLHPSFVLGYTLLTVYFLVRLVAGCLVQQPTNMILCAGVLIASLAATLVNPYGIELHKSILILGNSTFFMRLHQEWLPLDVMSGEGRAFEIAAAVLLVYELFLRPSGARSPRWFAEMAVIVLLAHGALAHVRILPYFGIMAAPALTRSIVGISRAAAQLLVRPFPGLVDLCNRLVAWEDRSFSGIRATLCLSSVCLIGAASDKVVGVTGALGPPRDEYPYHGVAVMRQATAAVKGDQRDSKPSRVLAPADWGGFITLQGGGVLQPLYDDRNTLIGEARYKEFLSKTGSCPAWIRFGKQLNADFILLPKRANPVEDCLSQGEFRVLFQDSVAMVLAPTRTMGDS
jgi:hypothetical protein